MYAYSTVNPNPNRYRSRYERIGRYLQICMYEYLSFLNIFIRNPQQLLDWSQVRRPKVGSGARPLGWLSKEAAASTTLVKTITLHLWCLNPAVCFDELKQLCRSIVLTSGTLSPLATFASELGVEFPVRLEASHVIDASQVWVGTLSQGPTGQYPVPTTFRQF